MKIPSWFNSDNVLPPVKGGPLEQIDLLSSKTHRHTQQKNLVRLRISVPKLIVRGLINPSISISLRYFIDWRGSNSTPSNGNGAGNDNLRCRILFGENKLRACLSMEFTEIRSLRIATGSEPALARNDRFHCCTRDGLTSDRWTLCPFVSHSCSPPF